MTDPVDTEVLVVGAGPTGLVLAEELRLAQVPFVLVDRLAERSTLSKAGGIQPRTQEALDQRGLLEPLLTQDFAVAVPAHFAGIRLDDPDERLAWRTAPQVEIEKLLEGHLATHGVRARRACELTALTQDDDAVTALCADGTTLRARWLVAADGGRSTVRSLLDEPFPGTPGTVTVVAADVRLSGEYQLVTHTRGDDGTWTEIFPLGTDRQGRPLHRLALGGPRSRPRDVPVTEEEIRDGLRAVNGTAVELLETSYAYRITDAARQAARYRHGRVFLAGDAAHVHLPLGAQGMNTGIQDAMNLGWKLGAAVHGWAGPGLLDTYHDERHPVGAAVLRNVAAQSLLMDWAGTGSPGVTAARDLVVELAALPEVRRRLTETLSGRTVRYPMPGAGEHPMVGRPAPDVDLGPARLHELLRAGGGVLVDPRDHYGDQERRWSGRIQRAGRGTDTDALLVRPDGYVCWAGDPSTLDVALGRWFGEPR